MNKELSFRERGKKFNKELMELSRKYGIGLVVNIVPANLFTRVFKRWITVRWNIILQDNGIQKL
jgi:hypothetical protein